MITTDQTIHAILITACKIHYFQLIAPISTINLLQIIYGNNINYNQLNCNYTRQLQTTTVK